MPMARLMTRRRLGSGTWRLASVPTWTGSQSSEPGPGGPRSHHSLLAPPRPCSGRGGRNWPRRSTRPGRIAPTRPVSPYPMDWPRRPTSQRLSTAARPLVMAVPSHGFREIYSRIARRLDDEVPVLSLTKGIEQDTLATMTQIVMEMSPGKDPALIGVMTGPNLASEVAAGQPTASVIAMSDSETARHLQDVFMGPTFRVYTHDDVVGCELGRRPEERDGHRRRDVRRARLRRQHTGDPDHPSARRADPARGHPGRKSFDLRRSCRHG